MTTTTSLTSGPVLLDIRDALAVVTLNRPEAHNALDVALKVRLGEVLAAVAADEEVRAVVLTGAGRSFCVGQDLGEHAAALAAEAATALNTVEEHYAPIVSAIVTMPKPVIAAVNGTCVGAGLGFAMACDLRVYAAEARLGTAFTGIGLTTDSGLAATLVAAVGQARASELILLGEMFSPQQAVEWGMSGRVVPGEQVGATALELGRRLAAGPTRAYAETKTLLAAAAGGLGVLEMVHAEADAQTRLATTADHAGAVNSFLAKQKPVFRGN
ncbi:MAG: enoyl-CoA hydratase-related protein [Nocardioides sp.]|uniref:enoyl-CoA hydratase/isomerase family protein n=1 Tax=Nocardioides sp. TaxID=35761 RepID=UPI0039E35F88